MADSSDKKSTNRQKNLEAELSVNPLDNSQEDEDAIDRLLMDAGFDADEELPHAVHDPVFPADFDEFGDDFDLADLSTADRISDTDINLAEGIKSGQDFPLELIDSVTGLPDEKQNANTEISHDTDLPIDSERIVQDDELDNTDGQAPVIDEFSDFQDFQQTSESDVPVFDEDERIVDADDLTVTEEADAYDEFGDDFDGYDDNVPVLAPSTDFDITADIDDDLIDNLGQANSLLDEPETIEAETVIDETISNEKPQKAPENEVSLIDAAGIAALMQFKADQEAINKKNKMQIAEFEAKAKKASLSTYAALGFGIISFITAVALGVMTYSAKNEQPKLAEQIAAMEKDKVGVVAKNVNQHQENSPDMLADHKTQVTTGPSQVKPEKPESEAKQEHSSATAADETKNKDPEIQKDKAEVKESSALPIEKAQPTTEPLKHEAHGAEADNHKAEEKPAEPPKENVAATATKVTAPEVSTSSIDALKKEAPKVAEKKRDIEHKPLEHQKAKTAIKEKKKIPIPTENKTAVKQERLNVSAASDWSVNLIAYKQQWYANGKAAEFAKKGIPVEIESVKKDNVTWYRLSVRGFSNKKEADAYAGRVKKALNLSSVWVGN